MPVVDHHLEKNAQTALTCYRKPIIITLTYKNLLWKLTAWQKRLAPGNLIRDRAVISACPWPPRGMTIGEVLHDK